MIANFYTTKHECEDKFGNLKKIKFAIFILSYCSNKEQIYYNGFRLHNRHAMKLTILRFLHW